MLVAGQGCSPPGFISRPVDNFRAYYNTFYNARRAYKQGVEGQATSGAVESKVERLEYVDIFAATQDRRPSRGRDA